METTVVDINLEKFIDMVNHDKLMYLFSSEAHCSRRSPFNCFLPASPEITSESIDRVILQPNNLTLWGDSGTTITDSFFMGFDNVSFPFKAKISFDQASQLSAYSTNRILSFEIFEPGNWEIIIFL